MKKALVFIDGQAGTTGLEIAERLRSRNDVELVELSDGDRKDASKRLEAYKKAELAVLCLPDDAAKETVSMVKDLPIRIIDASTAHRTAEGWIYGTPELKPDFREKIRGAKYVANPGCHASGFIIAIRPLLMEGILKPEDPISVNSVSGYSGGGKSMIADFRNASSSASGNEDELHHYANYKLDLAHKHLPEMTKWAGLSASPLFLPAVDHFYRGMTVNIPLHASILKKNGASFAQVKAALQKAYAGEKFIRVLEWKDAVLRGGDKLAADRLKGTNHLEIVLSESVEGHTHLAVAFDNLGKGASGSAVQNLNLMLGFPEEAGLD